MKALSFVAAAAATLTFILVSCAEQTTPATETVAAEANTTTGLSNAEMVKRGGYLVTAIGCDDCHSPKIMTAHGMEIDSSRRLSGHPTNDPVPTPDKSLINDEHALVFTGGLTACVGPWGTTYAANLTPDDTGTGAWTEAQFVKAIREGKLKGMDGTRPIMPPMPWTQYRNLSDDDLKSIYAYLRTIKPVNNVVPAPKPPL
jgi:cytochrome c553